MFCKNMNACLQKLGNQKKYPTHTHNPMRLPYTGILGEILGSFASLRELPRPFATLRLCAKSIRLTPNSSESNPYTPNQPRW